MTKLNNYDLKEINEKKGSVLAFDLGIKKLELQLVIMSLKPQETWLLFTQKIKINE